MDTRTARRRTQRSNAAERVAAWRSMRKHHRWDWLTQLFSRKRPAD